VAHIHKTHHQDEPCGSMQVSPHNTTSAPDDGVNILVVLLDHAIRKSQ